MPRPSPARKKEKLPPIRLLVIDDNSIFLQTLVRFLSRDVRLTVIGTATNAAEGLILVKDLNPGLVLVDLQMPETSGLQLIPLIRSQAPDVCILAMTFHDDRVIQRAALQRGAHAVIQKDEMFQELIPLIHQLYETGCGNKP